jgi:hypothetical protein
MLLSSPALFSEPQVSVLQVDSEIMQLALALWEKLTKVRVNLLLKDLRDKGNSHTHITKQFPSWGHYTFSPNL